MAFYLWDAVQCTYVLLSIIFNALLVIILRKYKKEFSGEFFNLCISQAVADFGQLFFGLFVFKLPCYGWYFDDLLLVYAKGWLPKVLMCIIWMFTTAQVIGMLNLAANRYTALAKPTDYSTIWGGNTVLYCILAHWLVPAIYAAPILFVGVHVERNNASDYVTFYFTDKTVENIYYGTITAFAMILGNCTVLVLYCLAFYKALAYRRKISSSTSSTTAQTHTAANYTEVKLAVCGFSAFCMVFIYAILMLFTYIAMDNGNDPQATILQKIRGLLLDIYSSMNPITLFIMSTKVREKFGELLHLSKPMKTKSAVTEVSKNYATSPRHRNQSTPNLAMISTSLNYLPSPSNPSTRKLSEAYSRL
uniref:G-protein coupled receptors family 1 profile domain-containing protein n=1 Tax=Plectus sambesii TaxID=2011161 RepID=A0A914V5Z1_9BILA